MTSVEGPPMSCRIALRRSGSYSALRLILLVSILDAFAAAQSFDCVLAKSTRKQAVCSDKNLPRSIAPSPPLISLSALNSRPNRPLSSNPKKAGYYLSLDSCGDSLP